MRAGLVATIIAARHAAQRQRTEIPPLAPHFAPRRSGGLALLKKTLLCLAGCLALAGCGGQPENAPVFIGGTNYAAVPTDPMTAGVPQAGTLSLYHYPDGPRGARWLIWPYLLAEDEAVFGPLVIFNGGLTDDMVWKYYPALLAFSGTGAVVEITQPACRRIPGWQPDWTNFAFSVLAISNNFVRLDASQCLPIEINRPKRLEVDLDKAEILKAVLAAQTNAESHTFNGVKYFVAE